MDAQLVEELAEQAAHVEAFEGRVLEVGDELADIGAEGAFFELAGIGVAEGPYYCDDAVGIGGDDACDEVGELLLGLVVDVAGHAAVDEAHLAAGEGEDVAGVRIGVEEAELEALAEDGAGAVLDDGAAVVVGEGLGVDARE